MAPKTKKGKTGGRKKKAPKEPKHDTGWEKTIKYGKWERPIEALPDPGAFPTFEELRQRVLSACEEISVIWSKTLTNEFIEELFRVPRENLIKLELRGSTCLTKVVISPASLAPNIQSLDLSCCNSLEYVLIQSTTLKKLSLARCISLKKALLHTNALEDLDLHQCSELAALMLWSDNIRNLDLGRAEMKVLKLFCPGLINFKAPTIKEPKIAVHLEPNINKVLEAELLKKPQRYQEEETKIMESDYTPYSSGPLIPRTCLLGF